MTAYRSAIFAGHVVHKRLTPARHGFAYKVFSLCLDVDEIDRLASELRLFSRNRCNLLSFYDADHGPGDGTPVAEHIRKTLIAAGLGHWPPRHRASLGYCDGHTGYATASPSRHCSVGCILL